MDIHALMDTAFERGASDLHLKVGIVTDLTREFGWIDGFAKTATASTTAGLSRREHVGEV